jgi:ABC-type branched-subunit amino acid transport system substrate-binding protein
MLALGELRDEASASGSAELGALAEAIELVDVDVGNGSPDEVRAAARALAGRTDVIAVLVALDADGADTVGRALADREAIVITTSGARGRPGTLDLLLYPEHEASAVGRFVGDELRARRPAVLATAVMASSLEARYFADAAERATAKVVAQTYPLATPPGTAPLEVLAKAGVDAVFLVGEPRDLAFAVREARVKGLGAPFLVTSTWSDAGLVDATLRSGSVLYTTAPYALDDGAELTREFANHYRRDVGGEPDFSAALAYDGARIALAGLRRAWTASPGRLDVGAARREAFGLVDFPGLAGPLAVDAAGKVEGPIAIRKRSATGDVFVTKVGR